MTSHHTTPHHTHPNPQQPNQKNATVGPDPEEEERIRQRQAGTPMSVEAFEAWKVGFDREMSERAQAEALRTGAALVMTEAEKAEFYAKVRDTGC